MLKYLSIGLFISSVCVANNPVIVPIPHKVVHKVGKFVFPSALTIGFEIASCKESADLLTRELKRYLPITIKSSNTQSSQIALSISRKNIHPQGYKLTIERRKISIIGYDKQGLRNGAISLLWLVRKYGPELPALVIIDWPDVKIRGMDIQWCFHKPSKLAMYDTARALAMLKYNIIVPELGPNLIIDKYRKQFPHNGISEKEFSEFVRYCYSWGLDVVPKLNALGHKERGVPWLKRLGNGLDMGYEDNYKMLFDIVREYKKMCPKMKYFHFGMDEAGSCLIENSKKYGKTPAELLAEHIGKICEFCKRENIVPIIYHDMLIGAQEDIYWKEGAVVGGTRVKSYPARKNIPKDVILDYWNYEGFSRYRTIENVQDEGFKIWFTPWGGVSVWTMAKNAYLLNAGYLASTWTDVVYTDVFRVYGRKSRRFYTQRWLQDAFTNAATFSWNVNHPGCNGFDPGFDSACITASLFWDKPYYLAESSRAIKLPECNNIDRNLIEKIYKSVGLQEGKVRIKGISFELNPLNAILLGNLKPTEESNLLKRPKPWRIYVDGKKDKKIDIINAPRKANSIVLYTREYGKSTKTNQYGREVNVRCGLTHYGDTWGVGNMAIPRNGFVLSGHGEGLYNARVFNGYHTIKIVDSEGREVPLGIRKPDGTEKARVRINSKASSIVFLHTTAYEAAHFMDDMLTITVNYADGSDEKFSLRYGRDICSFDDVCFLYDKQNPQRKWIALYNAGKSLHDGRLIYAYQWFNPHPKVKVLDVAIKMSESGRRIGYVLLGLSVIGSSKD